MSSKHSGSDTKVKASPIKTVAHLTDQFIEDLDLPPLPDSPQRLADAVRDRINAHLFRLKESRRDRYHTPFEIRLVRDTHRIVLTAYELGLPDAEAHYAQFRELVEEMGYERTDVGYRRKPE